MNTSVKPSFGIMDSAAFLFGATYTPTHIFFTVSNRYLQLKYVQKFLKKF